MHYQNKSMHFFFFFIFYDKAIPWYFIQQTNPPQSRRGRSNTRRLAEQTQVPCNSITNNDKFFLVYPLNNRLFPPKSSLQSWVHMINCPHFSAVGPTLLEIASPEGPTPPRQQPKSSKGKVASNC